LSPFISFSNILQTEFHCLLIKVFECCQLAPVYILDITLCFSYSYLRKLMYRTLQNVNIPTCFRFSMQLAKSMLNMMSIRYKVFCMVNVISSHLQSHFCNSIPMPSYTTCIIIYLPNTFIPHCIEVSLLSYTIFLQFKVKLILF